MEWIKSILLMIVQLLIVLSTLKLRFKNISKTAELAGKLFMLLTLRN